MSERCSGCRALHWDGVELPNADLCKVNASSKVYRDCPQWLPAAMRECLDRTTARALAAEARVGELRGLLVRTGHMLRKESGSYHDTLLAQVDAALAAPTAQPEQERDEASPRVEPAPRLEQAEIERLKLRAALRAIADIPSPKLHGDVHDCPCQMMAVEALQTIDSTDVAPTAPRHGGAMTSDEALRIARANACYWSDQPDDLHQLSRWVVSVLGDEGRRTHRYGVAAGEPVGDTPVVDFYNRDGDRMPCLSTAEARRFAADILRAADHAEGKEP